MLFRRRKPDGFLERVRTYLWPRRSFSRSLQYFSKRILRLKATPHAVAADPILNQALVPIASTANGSICSSVGGVDANGCIAVYSTARGPALGGTRMWAYATEDDALGDALRLGKAMAYKAATPV